MRDVIAICPVGDVCLAAIPDPVLDVMSFAPGRGFLTARKAASAVPHGKSRALAGGEEPLFATNVEDVAVHVDCSALAEVLGELAERDGREASLEERRPSARLSINHHINAGIK